MVGQHREIHSLIPKEVICPTEFSRWVRLQPFTHIKNTYHTSCCLISSRIHSCKIRFNHNRCHYKNFGSCELLTSLSWWFCWLSFSPPHCLSKPLSPFSSPKAPGPLFISSWSPPIVWALRNQIAQAMSIGYHKCISKLTIYLPLFTAFGLFSVKFSWNDTFFRAKSAGFHGSFLPIGTWVFFWLVTFTLFGRFSSCTTGKKLIVKLLMWCNIQFFGLPDWYILPFLPDSFHLSDLKVWQFPEVTVVFHCCI